MCNNCFMLLFEHLIITVVMLNKLQQNIGKHWNTVNDKQKKLNSKSFVQNQKSIDKKASKLFFLS